MRFMGKSIEEKEKLNPDAREATILNVVSSEMNIIMNFDASID